MIYNSVHDMFIRRAIELAKQAKKKSNAPFGALLVHNGVVLMEAENTVVTDRDPTRHAELSLVSAACRTLSAEDIVSCTLYTSTEPCAMCAGAIYWAGITRVVFGFPESGLQKLVSSEDRDGNLGVDSRAILRMESR